MFDWALGWRVLDSLFERNLTAAAEMTCEAERLPGDAAVAARGAREPR
jgi:hypothetical protein